MELENTRSNTDRFLNFNYPELKDLGKHFLTISSATAIIVISFFDRITQSTSSDMIILVKISIVFILISIVSAGTGLFVNYIAGAGANGSIIWGVGKNYRIYTMGTYILYMFAGGGLVFSYSLLVLSILIYRNNP